MGVDMHPHVRDSNIGEDECMVEEEPVPDASSG